MEHGWYGLPTRVLLADHSQQCSANSEVMQGVLVLHHVGSYLSPGALDDTHYLAICCTGFGSSGGLQKSTRGLDPPTRHSR
jgi:hypothetical protein